MIGTTAKKILQFGIPGETLITADHRSVMHSVIVVTPTHACNHLEGVINSVLCHVRRTLLRRARISEMFSNT